MFDFLGTKEISRLIFLIKPHKKKYFSGLLGLAIGDAALYIMLAFVLKYWVEAIDLGDMTHFYNALILIGVTLVVVMIILPILFYYYKKAVRITMATIKKDVFNKIQKLPMEYLDKNHAGELMSIFSNDILLVDKAYAQGFREIVKSATLGFASAIVMLIIDWRIASILISLALLLMLINLGFSAPIRKISDKVQFNMGTLTERFKDQLEGFLVLKMFNTEDVVKRDFLKQNDEVVKLSLHRVNKTAFLEGTNFFLSISGFGGSLVIGAIMVIRGEIDFATLAIILQLQLNISGAFLSIGKSISTLQISLASAKRVFDVIDSTEENLKKGLMLQQQEDHPVIEFKELGYSYNNVEKVLDGVSLSINKGEVVAFVGPSGGGKSTILKLLLGFYPVGEGDIEIYGKSIGNYSLIDLRNNIAYVPQQNYIFEDTIKNNIKYGQPKATDEEIVEAAKSANIHEFISSLPDGYDSLIKEGGKNLSGGQKQRIAIARAFLKNADIILLDEATSALDADNEHKIQEALDKLMKGRTVIMVAHRLSTIQAADKIIVVSNGHIVEEGSHKELIDNNGLYSSLANNRVDTGRFA